MNINSIYLYYLSKWAWAWEKRNRTIKNVAL